MDGFLILAGLALTFSGASWLVRGAAGLAKRFRLSPFVVGLTVVALGTSAPELFVAADSSVRGASDLVLGNVLGSNLANIGLILGITALIHPLTVDRHLIRRDLPFMLAVTVLLFPVLMGGSVTRVEGVALLAGLPLYLAVLVKWGPPRPDVEHMIEAAVPRVRKVPRALILILAGAAGLTLGAEVLVTGALGVATTFGVPQVVVGLTVVAIGTSVPELATSTVAAMRGEPALAVGNVVGSNIANTTLVLGTAALLKPLTVQPGLVTHELPTVLLLSGLALPLAWTDLELRRWEGGVLVASYALVTLWLLP